VSERIAEKLAQGSTRERQEMTEETDQQLVDRVLDGDKNAFNLLVLRYQHRVAGLVSRFIQDAQEVEDVSQEAFIKAYRALPLFRGDSAFYTWLYRIAVNTAKNYLVSRNRRPPASDVDINDAEVIEIGSVLRDIEDPEGSLATDKLKQAINAAIEELPEDLKTAFTLREFSGMSYEDITEVMDCPVGTVRSRIFRAREAIDKRIKELL
jgi:RNA polymerase sigma-70 factor (ECF subfamily)